MNEAGDMVLHEPIHSGNALVLVPSADKSNDPIVERIQSALRNPPGGLKKSCDGKQGDERFLPMVHPYGLSYPNPPLDVNGNKDEQFARYEVIQKCLLALAQLQNHTARGKKQNDRLSDSLRAGIADTFKAFERIPRGSITEIAKSTGYKPQTLRVDLMVAKRLDVLSRLNTLPWDTHVRVVKALGLANINEAPRWLAMAEENSWSGKRITHEINNSKLDDSYGNMTVDNEISESCKFQRELKRLTKTSVQLTKYWMNWSPDFCVKITRESESLREFFDEMEAKASQASSNRK